MGNRGGNSVRSGKGLGEFTRSRPSEVFTEACVGFGRMIMWSSFRKHFLWLFALAGIYAVILYMMGEFKEALPRFLPIDDSYSILHFARNVVERGDFFSYNPGALSTGITCPLYCLLLAAIYEVFGGGNVGWHSAVAVLGTFSFLPSTVTMKTCSPPFQQIKNYWIIAIHMCNPLSYDAAMLRSAAGESAFMVLRKNIPLMIPAACSLFFLRKRLEHVAVFMYVPLHLVIAGFKNAGFGDNDRYLTFDYALAMLYLAVLFGHLVTIDWKRVYSSFRAKVTRNVIRCISAGIAVALSAVILADYSRNIMHYRIMANYFYTLDYQIGEWLAKNTPPDTCVALFQAGGTAFFGRRRIIDGGGVTEHTIWPYLKRGAFCEAMVERGADYVAPFGDEWLVGEGLHMRDTRFFSQVPLRCRGLYKINKPALAQYVEVRKHDNNKSNVSNLGRQ